MRTLKYRFGRLATAAALSFVVCAVITYLSRPEVVYALYRCTTAAASPIDCYLGRPTAFETTTLGAVYEGITDNLADRHVLAFGAWEKPQLMFLKSASRGGVFVDVGANKGLYSVFMSRHASRVIAFEPWDPVLRKFRRYVERNAIKNIVIHPVGLGETSERLPFAQPTGPNMGLGSFAFLRGGEQNALELVAGDDALKDVDVEIIKIDIEGFERPALRGLEKTLRRTRPIVLFELTVGGNNPVLFQSLDQIRETFPPDYEFLAFTGRDLYTGAYALGPLDLTRGSASRFLMSTSLKQQDVVAFPVEKRERIAVWRD